MEKLLNTHHLLTQDKIHPARGVQMTVQSMAQNDLLAVTHQSDLEAFRLIEILEKNSASPGVSNSSLDFDLADESQFIQEDATNGTDFVGGVVQLHDDGSGNFPLTPYYVTTSDKNNINLESIDTINSLSVTISEPTNTTLHSLVSFDGRTTWKKWNGAAWIDFGSDLGVKSGWNTITEIQVGMTALDTTNLNLLDFAFLLGTSDSSATPSIDQINLNYDEIGVYEVVDDSGYDITCIDNTTTTIKKLSSGTADVKVNIIV